MDFFFAYLISPRFCHRFVGYLEEEAVHTYTMAIEMIEKDHIPEWKNLDASILAKRYWKLPDDAKFLDVLKCIRLDEAHHRSANHAFANVSSNDPAPADPLEKGTKT